MAKSKASDMPVYRIELPESTDWTLEDLYVFPRTFEQCYTFIYCLDSDLPARDKEAIDNAFSNYPWAGGYSYVNFYQILRTRIPPKSRPKLRSIHKASPGWIELALNLDVAVEVAKSVALISGSSAAAAAAYKKAWTLLLSLRTEREKAKTEQLRQKKSQVKEVRETCNELAKCMGFTSLADLHKRTKDPEISLKMLSAHYRRMRTLHEYEAKGKVHLPWSDDA